MKRVLCIILTVLTLGCVTVSAEENYYLNIERERQEAARTLYTFVYDALNRDGELDYMSEMAEDCANRADEIQMEIQRTKKAEEPKNSGLNAGICLFLGAAAIVIVMLWMNRMAKKGVKGMEQRDIRRSLLKYRYVILAAGLVCAIVTAVTLKLVSRVPDTGGEYIEVVEALADYCDETGNTDVKYHELSYAMNEILSSRTAKNPDEAAAGYRVKAERLRSDSKYSDGRSWQDYTQAITGPEKDYSSMIKAYAEHNLEARLLELEAERCESIAGIMEKGKRPSKKTARRIEGYIDAAAKRLRGPVMPYAALGFIAGIILAKLAVALLTALKLRLRRNRQRKQTENSSYRELMESINSRG